MSPGVAACACAGSFRGKDILRYGSLSPSQMMGGKAPCCVYKIFQNADLGEFHVLLARAAKIVGGEIRISA